MPLILNVGISKKQGLPDYGSVGAICNVTLELDAGLLSQDREAWQRQVRSAYAACTEVVDEELARHAPSRSETEADHPRTPGNGSPADRHGPSNGQGTRPSRDRPATASQVRALHAIASRQRIDLAAELQSRFGVERAEQLSLVQASELIDQIKPVTADSGYRR